MPSGDADDVHQERQRHQDLDAIFAAGRNAGNARLLAIGTGEKAIADEHGPAVFQPPDRALPRQVAIAVANAIGIDVVVAMRVAEFQFGRPTSGRFFLPPPLAALPPFAFAFQAIARRPGGLRLGKRGLVAYLWLVLCQPFRETSDFRFQAMVIGAEALVIGLDFRQAAFQFRPVPFRLSNSSIILLARAHAISIAQVDPVSCASLSIFRRSTSPALGPPSHFNRSLFTGGK